MVKKLTPNNLMELVSHYDYEITREQSIQIMELLDDFSVDGFFNMTDIEMATDYIVNDKNSIFASCFYD